jgi:hypothetical protein
VIPAFPAPGIWNVVVDTACTDGGAADQRIFAAGERFPLQGRSLALLIRAKQLLLTRELAQVTSSETTSSPVEQSADGARED